jgi:aryl-alcohol dehydrogenase-like predicted oxidoreductase
VETRRLGSTDLQLTPVGVGTAPIGSGKDWPVWWGPQDPTEAVRAIERALDLGINWIDTAPFYGWGRAEEIVARALRGGEDQVLVFTKCGTFPDASGSRMDLSGISNHPAELVERALPVGPVGALQYEYSLLTRVRRRLPPASCRTASTSKRWTRTTFAGSIGSRRSTSGTCAPACARSEHAAIARRRRSRSPGFCVSPLSRVRSSESEA